MNTRPDSVTRRQLIMAFTSMGAATLASPFVAAMTSEQQMVARIFFDSYGSMALRYALRYAGDDGFVASLPQLLHARTDASYDNIIWNTWFTTNSEENVVTTPAGNRVVVTVHGGGIFAQPIRIERALRANLDRSNTEGLTGQYAAKITDREAHDLLQGRLPDGAEIPLFDYDEFKRGIVDLPIRYGVVLDFEIAKKAASGFETFDALQDEPIMVIRAGGVEPMTRYLEKAKQRKDTEKMGNLHRHNSIDPAQPQSRVLKLGGAKGGKGSDGSDQGTSRGYDVDWGISAGGHIDLARYVAVAPRDMSTSLQNLDFTL